MSPEEQLLCESHAERFRIKLRSSIPLNPINIYDEDDLTNLLQHEEQQFKETLLQKIFSPDSVKDRQIMKSIGLALHRECQNYLEENNRHKIRCEEFLENIEVHLSKKFKASVEKHLARNPTIEIEALQPTFRNTRSIIVKDYNSCWKPGNAQYSSDTIEERFNKKLDKLQEDMEQKQMRYLEERKLFLESEKNILDEMESLLLQSFRVESDAHLTSNPDLELKSIQAYFDDLRRDIFEIFDKYWKPGSSNFQKEKKTQLKIKLDEFQKSVEDKHAEFVEKERDSFFELERGILEKCDQLVAFISAQENQNVLTEVLEAQLEDMERFVNEKGCFNHILEYQEVRENVLKILSAAYGGLFLVGSETTAESAAIWGKEFTMELIECFKSRLPILINDPRSVGNEPHDICLPVLPQGNVGEQNVHIPLQDRHDFNQSLNMATKIQSERIIERNATVPRKSIILTRAAKRKLSLETGESSTILKRQSCEQMPASQRQSAPATNSTDIPSTSNTVYSVDGAATMPPLTQQNQCRTIPVEPYNCVMEAESRNHPKILQDIASEEQVIVNGTAINSENLLTTEAEANEQIPINTGSGENFVGNDKSESHVQPLTINKVKQSITNEVENVVRSMDLCPHANTEHKDSSETQINKAQDIFRNQEIDNQGSYSKAMNTEIAMQIEAVPNSHQNIDVNEEPIPLAPVIPLENLENDSTSDSDVILAPATPDPEAIENAMNYSELEILGNSFEIDDDNISRINESFNSYASEEIVKNAEKDDLFGNNVTNNHGIPETDTTVPNKSSAIINREEHPYPLIFRLTSNGIQMGTQIGEEFKIIRNANRESSTFPAVGVNAAGHFVCGAEALNCQLQWSITHYFARNNPDLSWKEKVTFKLGNEVVAHSITVEFLIGLIFKSMKESAEKVLKKCFHSTFITIPIWLSSPHRVQIKDAAKIAGFREVHLFNAETVAACSLALRLVRINENRSWNMNFLVVSQNFDIVCAVLYQCCWNTNKCLPKLTMMDHTYSLTPQLYQMERLNEEVINRCEKVIHKQTLDKRPDYLAFSSVLCPSSQQILQRFAEKYNLGFTYEEGTMPSHSDLFGASMLSKLKREKFNAIVKEYVMMRLVPNNSKTESNKEVTFLPTEYLHEADRKTLKHDFHHYNIGSVEKVLLGRLDWSACAKYEISNSWRKFHIYLQHSSEGIMSLKSVRRVTKDNYIEDVTDFVWETTNLSDSKREEFANLVNRIWHEYWR